MRFWEAWRLRNRQGASPRRSLQPRRISRWSLFATLTLLVVVALYAVPPAEAASVAFTAAADAQVSSDAPGANFGSARTLNVDGTPVSRAYLRFNVSIPSGAVVTRTTLRLYFTSSSSSGFDISYADSGWSEGGITYNNAPPLGAIQGSAASIAGGWSDTSIRLADGNVPVTYVITRTNDVGVAFQSRENVNKPQLIVEYAFPGTTIASIPASSPTVTTDADARVDQGRSNTNFGTSYLSTDGGSNNTVESYLRFSVGGFLGKIQSAKLRVFASTATSDGPAVYATTNDWSEGAITWSNRPALTSGAHDDKGAIARNTWVDYDVTPFVSGNGTYSFVLATSSTARTDFQSREQTMRPQLVVTVVPGHLEVVSDGLQKAWGTAVSDLNGDGRDDFFAGMHGDAGAHTSLQDPTGSFVAGFSFPHPDRHGCTAGDVNRDGYTDIYCEIGADRGTAQNKDNELWMGQPDGTYVDQAAIWGVTDNYGRGRRPLLFDFNRDGLLDLYITNSSRSDGKRSENILYINTGSRFVEQQVSATGSFGYACARDGDWDRDGFLDLVICGPQLHLFHNAGGLGTDLRDSLLGTTPVNGPRDAVLEDLNGDGLDDLVIVTADELQVRLNLGSGARFSQIDKRVPLVDGWAATVGDFSGDGIPDIYVVQGFANDRNVDDLLLTGPTWLQAASIQAAAGEGCTANSLRVLGRATALVTNGCSYSRGPVQFVSYHAG